MSHRLQVIFHVHCSCSISAMDMRKFYLCLLLVVLFCVICLFWCLSYISIYFLIFLLMANTVWFFSFPALSLSNVYCGTRVKGGLGDGLRRCQSIPEMQKTVFACTYIYYCGRMQMLFYLQMLVYTDIHISGTFTQANTNDSRSYNRTPVPNAHTHTFVWFSSVNFPIFDPPNPVKYCYLATYSYYVKKVTLDPLNPTVWLAKPELQRAS